LTPDIYIVKLNSSILLSPIVFWAQLNFSGPEFIFAKFWEIKKNHLAGNFFKRTEEAAICYHWLMLSAA
jgi:hypothetical protein